MKPLNSNSKSSSKLKQTKIITEKPILSLCSKLSVHAGIPFNAYSNPHFKKLISFAKKGANDVSGIEINVGNIKKYTLEEGELHQKTLKQRIKNKFVSLSVDLATCQTRSFLGEL